VTDASTDDADLARDVAGLFDCGMTRCRPPA
jgi:hypothetical protein